MVKPVLTIPLFILIFFLLFCSNVNAYFPVDINIAYSGTIYSFRGLACTNLTGTFYCYLMGGVTGTNHIIIERYNATWQDRKWCDSGLSGSSAMAGFGIANSTHVVWQQTDDTARIVPINNIESSTSCSASAPFGSLGADFYIANAGYYDVKENGISGWNYWGIDGDIRNSTSQTLIASGWWDLSIHTLRLPNQSVNTTIYGMGQYSNSNHITDTSIKKYTNGVLVGSLSSLHEFYGSGNCTICWWDIFKQSSSTTWIYQYNGRLYRMNFTNADLIGSATTIEIISPIDNTSMMQNPPNLHIQINTQLNGSLAWYLDGSSVGTTNIISNSSTQDIYFSNPNVLSTGYHYWQVKYTDNYSYIWESEIEEFIEGKADFFTDPMENLAQTIGGFFSVDDLETSKTISSIIFAFLIALFFPFIIIIKSKQHLDGNVVLYAYIIIFFTILVMFSLINWFPSWLMILLIVIGAFGFVSIGKLSRG